MTATDVLPGLIAGVDLSPLSLSVIGVLSLAIGVLSGMVGMSLCVMRLPLMLGFGIDPLITAGTNLAVGVVSGVTATWPHYRAGRVAMRMVIFMGIPSIGGAYVGGYFSEDVPTWVLLSLVAVFLAVSGVSMIMSAVKPVKVTEQTVAASNPGNPGVIERARLYTGAGVGLVIGLVGGGGIGFILVQYIRLLDYRAAGIAVWFIAITVALLDYVSAEIRNKLA